MAQEDMGDFQGTEIDFSEAYHDARKLMGTVGTDLNDLHYNVGLMYLNAPDKWVEPYLMLMTEITMRQEIMGRTSG